MDGDPALSELMKGFESKESSGTAEVCRRQENGKVCA